MKVDEFAKKLNLFFTEVESATLERLSEGSKRLAAQDENLSVPMHNHSLRISDPPASMEAAPPPPVTRKNWSL